MQKHFATLLIALLCLISCSSYPLPFFWKSYTHPSYGFEFQYPRSWTLQEGGSFGTAINVLTPKSDPIFTSNFNIVIDPTPKLSLAASGKQAETQLSQLLSDYQVLARAERMIANQKALEIRASYKALNDVRIIRSFMFRTKKYQYVITFTSRKETEHAVQKSFHTVLDSFKIPVNG